MSSGKHLFIGGSADGKRMDLCGELRDTYNVPVPPKNKTAFCRLTADSPTYSIETYRRESIRCDKREWCFYVLATMPRECAIDRLLAGYAPERRAQEGKCETCGNDIRTIDDKATDKQCGFCATVRPANR